jgi:hypothetical protein
MIGGGISSGCSLFSGDNEFDSCGVVEFFDPGTTKMSPNWSWIIPSVTMTDGTKLGVVGIKAINSSPGSTAIFVVLKLGEGADNSTKPD